MIGPWTVHAMALHEEGKRGGVPMNAGGLLPQNHRAVTVVIPVKHMPEYGRSANDEVSRTLPEA